MSGSVSKKKANDFGEAKGQAIY